MYIYICRVTDVIRSGDHVCRISISEMIYIYIAMIDSPIDSGGTVAVVPLLSNTIPWNWRPSYTRLAAPCIICGTNYHHA